MKIKLYSLPLLLFCLPGSLQAQYFQPGEQAKGYLESRNTSVDFCTGIFHYNIPLFEITSGNFKLPVTLSYSGQGVKPENMAGIAGRNWNLLSGGVLTVTKRAGGYNDENDIYTVVINGQTTHFLLFDQTVSPLEKTNVRIKYNQEKDTWFVTDENGIKYYFDVREITKNGSVEASVSLNNLDHVEYTSSWYPSRICIPGAEPILFEYSVPYNGKNAMFIDSVNYLVGVANLFYYGVPMKERPFDFMYYRYDFNYWLDRVYEAAEYEYQRDRMNTTISIIDMKMGDIYFNTSYDAQLQNLKLQRQIMGVLTDLHEISGYSQQLFELLNEMKWYYGENSSASWYIYQAKYVLDNMVREVRMVNSRSYPSYSMYTTMPVYLEKIKHGKQEMIFDYNRTGGTSSSPRMLKSVICHDFRAEKVQEIRFVYGNELMKKLTWIDKTNLEIKAYDFSYFHENASLNLRLQEDYWGFYSNMKPSPRDSLISCFPDETYAKRYSLAKIVVPDGGVIEVDYELNRYGGAGHSDKFGGIRLKQVVLKNNGGNVDSIKYHYPGSGRLLYDRYLTREIVRYGSGVQDIVIRSRAKFTGNAHVNTGNNGILYDYVIEELQGKGFNTYLFCVPKSSSAQMENTYPFWLCGLPLAHAVYDKHGNLIELQKMKYFTDLDFCNVNVPVSDWFQQGEDAFNYTEKICQKKKSEYFIHVDDARSKYEQYKPTLIYNDLGDFGVLYYDPMDSYYDNVAPRTNAFDSESPYSLYYGGKTLLKEQTTYKFIGTVSSSPVRDHLAGALPSGYNITGKTECLYDTLNTTPVGMKRVRSNGDEEFVFWKNPLCFNPGVNAVLDEMRDSNYLMPVKQFRIIREAGEMSYTLLSENVVEYTGALSPVSGRVFLPTRTYSYKGEGVPYPTNRLNVPEESLFTGERSNYEMDVLAKHEFMSGKYLETEREFLEGREALCYEKERDNVILTVMNTPSDHVAATDVCRWSLGNDILVSRVRLLDSLAREIDHYLGLMDWCEQTSLALSVFNTYIKTRNFTRIKDFLKMIDKHEEHFEIIKYMIDSVTRFSIEELWQKIETIHEVREYFLPMIPLVENFCMMTGKEYNLFCRFQDGETISSATTEEIEVKTGDLYQRFTLVVLVNPPVSTLSLDYTIVKGSTTSTRSAGFQNLIPGRWQLARFTLDAGQVSGATSLKVSVPLSGKGIALAVLVPERAVYNAVAYNADGSVFCKFNQNGEMQLHEYDSANRPGRVRDQFGNILEEYRYNNPKTNGGI